jgi:hypothetical protein
MAPMPEWIAFLIGSVTSWDFSMVLLALVVMTCPLRAWSGPLVGLLSEAVLTPFSERVSTN